jgi:hypothetical protein
MLESVFGNHLVLSFAEDEADAGLNIRMTQQAVDRRQIEIHFAGELGLERNGLQIYYYVATQPQVTKKQIDAEFLASQWVRAMIDLQSRIPHDRGINDVGSLSLLRGAAGADILGISSQAPK